MDLRSMFSHRPHWPKWHDLEHIVADPKVLSIDSARELFHVWFSLKADRDYRELEMSVSKQLILKCTKLQNLGKGHQGG